MRLKEYSDDENFMQLVTFRFKPEAFSTEWVQKLITQAVSAAIETGVFRQSNSDWASRIDGSTVICPIEVKIGKRRIALIQKQYLNI